MDASELLVVVALIELDYEETNHSQGKIKCPICEKGQVSYTRAKTSIWAKCDTKSCVCFHADMKG